jgi:hypothetical protein
MLETIIAGLLLAAVSAITYLAYKHPSAYRKIYWPLETLSSIILVANSIWTFGVQFAYTQLTPLIEISKLPQMDEAMNRIMYRFWVVLATCGGASVYLVLLWNLPKLLEQEKKESPHNPSPEKKDENI